MRKYSDFLLTWRKKGGSRVFKRQMRKLLPILILLAVCQSCTLKDRYVGEPNVRERFVVDGEPYTWEDYGKRERNVFYLDSSGELLYAVRTRDSMRIVGFKFDTPQFSYAFTSNQEYFFDGRRYEVNQETFLDKQCFMRKPYVLKVVKGWFSFTRKKVEPIDRYIVNFEFDCVTDLGDTVRVRDGQLAVCRRNWSEGYEKYFIIPEPK